MSNMTNSLLNLQEMIVMSDERWYSAAEIQERYRVSRKTVMRWIEDGKLPGARKKAPYKRSPYEIPQSAIDYFEKQRNSS